jgi:hypothetical protein
LQPATDSATDSAPSDKRAETERARSQVSDMDGRWVTTRGAFGKDRPNPSKLR